MTKKYRWQLVTLCGALLAQTALAGLSAHAETRRSKTADMVVAVSLTADSKAMSAVEARDEPRVEVLLLQAQRKHNACTAEVQDLMDQAYDLIFRGVEVPLGGDEAMIVVK